MSYRRIHSVIMLCSVRDFYEESVLDLQLRAFCGKLKSIEQCSESSVSNVFI